MMIGVTCTSKEEESLDQWSTVQNFKVQWKALQE